MKCLIISGLAALAIGLTGCGGTVAPASAPSPVSSSSTVIAAPTTTPPPPAAPQLPHAVLANITLPDGSTVSPPIVLGGQTIPNDPIKDQNESWSVSAPYDTTVQSIKDQLPVGADYEGLQWCTEIVDGDGNQTMWGWGDSTKTLWISVVNTDPHDLVFIDRRPDEFWDRSDCDAEKAAETTKSPDEKFVAYLANLMGVTDTNRENLIAAGKAACEVTDEGLNAMDAVGESYGLTPEEAGYVTVAAEEVYCP